MKTDLERLHENVKKRSEHDAEFVHHRGTGKTFTRCHDVAGFLEVGHNLIYCTITKWNDLDYLIPMLRGVLDDHGLKMSKCTLGDRPRYEVFEGPQAIGSVRFILQDNFENATRGVAYDSYVEVPMGHKD